MLVQRAKDTCLKDILVAVTTERPRLYTPDIVGSYIRFNTTHTCWQVARVVGIAEDAEIKSLPDTTKMLDLGKQYNVNLSQDTLTTDGEERGDWCWHVHQRTRSVKNCKPSLELDLSLIHI